MYVDVDTCRIHLKFQEIAWLRLAGNERFVAIHYSLMEVGMTHVAPVDNKILQRIPSACIFRTGDITVNLYQRGVNIYREEMRVEIILPYIHDALLERTPTQIHLAGAEIDTHADIVVDQCQTLKLPHYIRNLHIIRLQELPTRRHIEEYVLHHDVDPTVAGTWFLSLHDRGIYEHAGAQLHLIGARLYLHLGYCAYRGQCLSAKPHRTQGEEIICRAYLGSGMTLESHPGIRLAHTLAIVNHLYQRASGILYEYLYISSTGIHSILHKLLDDRRGTLDHLSCRYLVGN